MGRTTWPLLETLVCTVRRSYLIFGFWQEPARKREDNRVCPKDALEVLRHTTVLFIGFLGFQVERNEIGRYGKDARLGIVDTTPRTKNGGVAFAA